MKTAHVVLALTLVNLALFAYQVTNLGKAEAKSDDSILRGTGLEIVDGDGRLRAQLTIAPGDPNFKMPDGSVGYEETVIFRLITPDGKPRVKMTTATDASGLMLLGSSDATYTLLQSDDNQTSLKLQNDEKTVNIVKP